MTSASEAVVLIVEPDSVVAALIGSFVHDSGFAAIHTADAVAAVRLHRQIGDLAAVLIEMDLPGPWNARQLSDALYHYQPTAHIIVTSASSTNEEIAAKWNMPFLRKPFAAKELIALLLPAEKR